MKNIAFFMVKAFLAIVFIVSCSDDDPENTGYGDAFILVEKNGGQELYGLGLSAFSLNPMSGVTAYAASQPGLTYILVPNRNLSTDYIYEAPSSSFSTQLPVTGDYLFDVKTKKGDTLTFINKLTSDIVMPPVINKCIFNVQLEEVELEWQAGENTDFFNLKAFDGEGRTVFISPVLAPAKTTFTFGPGTQGWQPGVFPADGTRLTIEVSSYLAESDGNGTYIQSVGRSVYSLNWGQ